MEREVLTEPFEVIAFDIVGPLPKGKGGCRFVLTAICMASKWPEAIPLRTITAMLRAWLRYFRGLAYHCSCLLTRGVSLWGH